MSCSGRGPRKRWSLAAELSVRRTAEPAEERCSVSGFGAIPLAREGRE